MPDTSGASSRTTTGLPACTRGYAGEKPANPAPTMQTSTCMFSRIGPHSGISTVADQTDWWRGMAVSGSCLPYHLQLMGLGRVGNTVVPAKAGTPFTNLERLRRKILPLGIHLLN